MELDIEGWAAAEGRDSAGFDLGDARGAKRAGPGAAPASAGARAAAAGAGGPAADDAPPDALRLVDPARIAERVLAIERFFASRSPYLLADAARDEAGRQGDKEHTYGITHGRVIMGLLRAVGARPDDVFYDLGCGVGHAVLAASLFVARATGIELLPKLCRTAEEARLALGIENARFIEADLRAVPLADATIIFSYSTCFGDALRAGIAERVAGARPGARVIMVTHGLDHPLIEATGSEEWEWSSGEPGTSTTTHRVLFYRVRAPDGAAGEVASTAAGAAAGDAAGDAATGHATGDEAGAEAAS